MRILGIEGTLALRMNIYEEEETEVLRDMYSLEQVCEFDTRDVVYEELLMQNQSRCKVSERLALPEVCCRSFTARGAYRWRASSIQTRASG